MFLFWRCFICYVCVCRVLWQVLATALQRHKDNAHIVATCLDVVANVTHIVMSMDKWVTAHEFHLKTHAALQEHPANVTVVVAGFGVLVQVRLLFVLGSLLL